MKRMIAKSLGSIIALSIVLTSCKKEDTYTYFVGNPTLTVQSEHQTASFGDSLEFTVQVADTEIALSTLKAQLYFTDDIVSETVIRTKENGTYMGKIYVPFYKNVPNGTATLKFVVQNISKKTAEQELDLALSRPDYPYLTLVTANGEYQMDKVGINQYGVTEMFPFSVKGYIKAPKYGENGNELTFGWVNNAIDLGSTNDIPFSNSNSGVYTISFNTLTYEAEPFIIAYAINGTVFNRIDDDHFKAELNLTQGESITIDGFEDFASWWIDSDFFTDDGSGNLTFNAMTGKYRITADLNMKYFAVEVMSGSDLAILNADGTGTIWIIGDGIGKPSVHTNQVGWNPGKALSMAPIGIKKYQVTLIGDKTAKKNDLNFKFFHQKDWGGEFGHNSISTTSDIIFVGNGTNGRDSGNIGLLPGKELEEDMAYIITIDLSAGNDNAVLTMTQQ